MYDCISQLFVTLSVRDWSTIDRFIITKSNSFWYVTICLLSYYDYIVNKNKSFGFAHLFNLLFYSLHYYVSSHYCLFMELIMLCTNGSISPAAPACIFL